jgi:hypothetical protein
MDQLFRKNEKTEQDTGNNNNTARTSSTSPTRKIPKKGILKNLSNSNISRRSIATSNASDLIFMSTSPPLSPKSSAKAEYNK